MRRDSTRPGSCSRLQTPTDVISLPIGGGEPAVRRHQPGFELFGKLDVETVDEPYVVATPPGTGEKRRQQVPGERRIGHPPQSGAGLTGGQQATPVQPAERGGYLRVEMGRNVHLTSSKPPLDIRRQL